MQQQNKQNPPAGGQAIHCNVKSCSHHAQGTDYCALNSISVAACGGVNTGKPADESMCASYEVQ
jgi:hypothetical protein